MINTQSPPPFRSRPLPPCAPKAQVEEAPATPPLKPAPVKADLAAQQAIDRFNLRRLGWMGFDQLDWVAQLRKDKPQAFELASSCSSHRPAYIEQTHQLFQEASPADRQRLQNYFQGKLGLEELSCRMSGAGAGMCDKRTAFMTIFEISQGY